jgi:hypothetical protein
MIHTTKVGADGNPASNNGLLYTAEACTIMQLQGVGYDRSRIASGLAADQVMPGLFKRAPANVVDQEAPDDWVGLGALAGVCGYHDVAQGILDYGTHQGATSSSVVAGMNLPGLGNITSLIQQCTTLPYNYNIVEPGKFTFETWAGKFPAIIVHWKLAAGIKPTRDEFAVWSAALIYSGKNPGDGQDKWIQAWLMILTYQTSKYHAAVADFAVEEWWQLFRARYPGGIRQTMTDYLAGGAPDNPFAERVQDFDNVRNQDAEMVDDSPDLIGLLDPIGGILTSDCGTSPVGACINLKSFSPTSFLAPFSLALSGATQAETTAQTAMI